MAVPASATDPVRPADNVQFVSLLDQPTAVALPLLRVCLGRAWHSEADIAIGLPRRQRLGSGEQGQQHWEEALYGSRHGRSSGEGYRKLSLLVYAGLRAKTSSHYKCPAALRGM